jgi:hypothetical protein
MVWSFGILFALIWLFAAVFWLPLPVLTSIAIPVLLSIISTVTTEAAESGRDNIRGNALAINACANVQWALMAFYVLIARGVLLPSTNASTKDGAWIWMFVSLLFAGVAQLKKYSRLAPLLAAVAFVIVLFFGRGI